MLQPSQDKSKVLYDVVSKDYDIGSYDEFSSKLQNPEKRKAFYEGVGKEYALGSYEEFESKVAPLKKKDKSDVTATPQKSVSETSTGSLDGVGSNGFPAIDKNLGVPGLKPDLKTVEQLANPPKSNATLQAEQNNALKYQKFKQFTTLSDERKKENAQKVEDEINGVGLLNNVASFGKEAYNSAIEGLSRLSFKMGSNTAGLKQLKVNTEPLADEKKEAKDLMIRQGVKPKDINSNTILELAKKIKLQKLNDSDIESRKKEFLSNTEVDFEDLKKGANLELSKISNKDKELLKQKAILEPALKDSDNRLNELNQQLANFKKNGQQPTPEFVDEYNYAIKYHNDIIKDVQKTDNQFAENRDKIGDLKTNLDLFKRQYGKVNNFISNIGATALDLAAGGFGIVDYGFNAAYGALGIDTGPKENSEIVTGLRGASKNIRDRIAKPINIDNIEDIYDFGDWMANTVIANQVPIYGLIATGPGGIVALGGSSLGTKYGDMIQEMNPDNPVEGQILKNYSNAELAWKPVGFGIAETASALVDAHIMKGAARVLASATQPERKLISQTIAKRLLEVGKQTAKGGIMESTDEMATQGVENLIDGKPFTEGMKDAGGAGGAMGALIPFFAGNIAIATKPFSIDNKIQNSAKKTLMLEKELANPNLSEEAKKIIQTNFEESKKTTENLLKKQVKDISKMSNENFQEILKIENKQAKLKEKAVEIKTQDGLSNDIKKQLLSDFSTKFKELEIDRVDILSGKKTMPKIEEKDAKVEIPITETQPQAEVPQQAETEKVEIKNEGKAEVPTEKNVQERLNINNPFYKKVNDVLVKLGLIEKYNPETGTGDIIGGVAQPLSGKGGFAVGDMYFYPDGSISYVSARGTVQFDKNGNVISENTKEVAQEKNKIEIEGTKESITNLEKTRDSEAFKYKEVTEIDILGNRKKVKRLKTTEELKESTDKINTAIDKAKSRLTELEKNQPQEVSPVEDVVAPSVEAEDNTAKLLNTVSDEGYNTFINKYIDVFNEKLGSNADILVEDVAKIYHDAKNNGSNPELVKSIEELLKNEATQNNDITPNGNLSTRTSNVGESGITEQQSTAKESVPSSVDVGKSEIANEVNLEDIQNFINETYLNDEKSSTTTEADQGAVKNSNEENRAIPIGEKGKKQVKVTKEGKVSLQGRKALSKRQFKGDRKTASEIDPTDATSLALKYFVNGGKIVSDYFASQGERQARSNGLNGIASSKGKTIDVIAHEIWESQENSELKLDTQEIKNAVEEVVNGNLTVQDAVASILGKYNVEEQNDADYEKDYAQAIQEYQQEENYSEEHIQEVESVLDYLSDAEIIELANSQEKSFDDYAKDLESRQVTYDLGPFSEKGTIQPDGWILSENGELLSPQSVRNVKQVNPYIEVGILSEFGNIGKEGVVTLLKAIKAQLSMESGGVGKPFGVNIWTNEQGEIKYVGNNAKRSKGLIQNTFAFDLNDNLLKEKSIINSKEALKAVEEVISNIPEKLEVKTPISKDTPELKEVNAKLEKANENLRIAKDALDRKAKSLDKELLKDAEDLFGVRKSQSENKLFDERVDADARNKATEKERKAISDAQNEIKSLKEVKAKIESGEVKSTKELAFEEVDKYVQKIKDILPGINDPDLNKQGISQDDLIDLVANAVKALVSKGIDVNDAIRQVVASIKERFNVEVDEKLVKEKLGVEKPKSKTKNPLREKSSEEISDELGISEKEYLDLKSFVANEPSSGIFNEYLSAETIADVFGDSPTNDQQYEQMVLLNAVQHGNSVLEKARSIFGENYMSKTLEFLQNVKLGNFEKAMVYAALENEIDTLVKSNPSNKVFLATQRLIYADSQANLRNSSKGLNAGGLRRIHNAIKNGYDVDKVTSGLIKPEQQEAKQILKDAIPTGDNLNKASEQEENEIDSEERIYTQNELDEAIEKARREFEEENLGFEIRESKVKIKKEDALEQIRKIKENWKKASRDGTLSASLPYAKQVIAVAPDVIKLAKLYSQIAGMKTIDIVQAIRNDVSEVFDLISEKDIKGILKKEYGAKSRKMSEATKRKIYVKLLNKAIESLDAQIEKRSRDVVKKVDKYANDSEIQNLRDLKKQRQEELEKIDPSYSDKKKLSNAIDSVNKSISELENKIADSDFSEKQKEVKEVDKKLAELREKRDSLRKEYNKRKDEYKKSLVSEDEKRKMQESQKITVLEKRLQDLKDKKAKDTLGKSSVWNAEISDLQNQIKQEKQRQEEPKKPKIKDVVKQALIDAGFSREITVTKNAKDENGNDIIDSNGKKVKIKETKQVLDWNKLTGRMNSVEALRANVEGKLKEQGYTDSQIEEISNELETEYKRLTEYIADKALTELERRNQIPKPVNRKSDLDRLVDYHNKGLFGESAKGYERLINKIVGITKREQDVLDKIEAEIEKIKNLREVKIDGSFPDAQSIESQASYIAKSIRNIIAWSNLVNSPLKLQIITVLSDIAGISRAAVLGNLYNAFQNIYSNNRAGFLARMKFKSKGYWTPELNDAFNELKNTVTSDVLLNRGLDFGDTVSPFSNHSIFIEKIKDYINKKYPEGVKRQRAIGVLNTFEGRLFLNVMDSRFKSKIVNIDFVMNLVDVLTSERAGKSKMTKEEAVNFVSESLTGVNLEKAKVLAKKFIDDVNAMKEGTLLKNEDNIKRLAFDIVRENLTSGNNFTMDEINDIYQASMKSGGINIGHESNNIVSEELKSLNNRIEKKVEDAMKEKDFDKATKYATYAFISKNILYPYMSGGLNWAVLEAEAGTPLGLATGAYKSYKNKNIDLLTDVGKKRMKEDLINKRDAESKLFRGIWGTSIAISAYLAYYGLQAVSGIGDDDEENKRIFNKYLREHPEQRKIFDKFSPEVYAVSLSVSDERLSKYLLNKMGYKTDQNDNVLTLLKSLQNKNSSTPGALGVLLGQIVSTPGAWRILRDLKRLFRELQGEPMAQTEQRVTSFLNGYFKGALVDYLGLRPGTNYDLEKVKKEIQNKKTDFTNYTNGIANDINSGKITKEDAAKLVEKKYEDNDELLDKAKEIIQNSVNDKEIREGLKDADIWYMEMYNEKDIRAKAYIYYQNVLSKKDFKEDKNFSKYMNLALYGIDEDYYKKFIDLAIEYKDVEEQKSKNKPVN